MCLHHPDRVIAVASVCTPYTPPHKKYVSLQDIVKLWPSFKYQVYFNSGDPPVQEFEGNERRFFQYFMRYAIVASDVYFFRGSADDYEGTKLSLNTETGPLLPDKDISLPKMLTQQEYDYYVECYKKSGFRATLNYYKTHKVFFRLPLIIF